jgi:hypothetical protein
MFVVERVLIEKYRMVLWSCGIHGTSDQSYEKFFERKSKKVKNGIGY